MLTFKMLRHQNAQGVSEHPTSWQMLFHLKFELPKPDAFYLMFFNTDCGERGICCIVCICCVNIQNDNLCIGNSILFLTDDGMDVLEK